MSKLSRNEFKELLTEWKQNFINERNLKQFKLTYPCYLVRTLNYGDLKYDNDNLSYDAFDQIPRSNETLYQTLLEESLKRSGIEFSIDRSDIPDKIIQINVKNISLEEKKQLTKKVIDIIYETSKSEYLQDYFDDEDLVTKHPPLNQDKYNNFLSTSRKDIEDIFRDIENTKNHSAPIFISHLDYDNNVYYSFHDIIGHGSIERAKHGGANTQSAEFSRKLYEIEENPNYSYAIRNQLRRLTPGVGEADISSSLASYFASINPGDAEFKINNFFKNSMLDDRKKEIIEILKYLYKEYKQDIERAESSIIDSSIGRYSNHINICFIYLDFED